MLRFSMSKLPACWLAAVLLAAPGGSVRASEAVVPGFMKKPSVAKDGEKFLIAFAADRETDVAVYIENTKGEVVRHLAAGVLGKNAPAPLKADSLEQSLEWDGKDDLGKAAAGGPFKARVALGLKPSFEKLIGFDPQEIGGVGGGAAIATGPGGELFLFYRYGSHHPEDSTTSCAVFNRDGKYLRTIIPYPANLPDDKLTGIKRLELPDGSKVPFIYQVETRARLPGLGAISGHRAVASRDGRLAFGGIREALNAYAQTGESRLTVVNTDGSVPADGVLKTLLAPLAARAPSLALSPDDKWIYAAGLKTASKAGYPREDLARATHAVYRFSWDDKETKVFVGDPQKPGAGEAELNRPESVATDKDGNVYVADTGNNRIAVFKPDGTPLVRIPVGHPLRVEVHRKTGAIYVLGGEKSAKLIKLDGLQTAREVASLSLPAGGILALDDSADPPVLWINVPLTRIEDKGNSFGEPRNLSVNQYKYDRDEPRSAAAGIQLSLDRRNGWLYVANYWRYRVADGKWERLPQPPLWGFSWPNSTAYATTGSAGLDGNYYMNFGAHGARIERFGPDMKPMPFPKPDGAERPRDKSKEVPGRIVGFAANTGQGLTADPFGNVYVLWKKSPNDPGDFHRATALYVYDSEGKRKVDKDKLIDSPIPGLFSVRVDYAGNVYVAAGLRKGKGWVPDGLKGQIPETLKDSVSDCGVNGYPLIYGSILKFGPKGGRIGEKIGGVLCNYGHGRAIEVKGAKWIVSEASTVSSWATPKNAEDEPQDFNICLCEAASFDVDGFGRSFFSDAGRCRVGVLDTAGNKICWFGGYGNPDSAGPGSAIPKPEIPFAWPQAVAVGDSTAYVNDRVNQRIVAVKLDYAAIETTAIP